MGCLGFGVDPDIAKILGTLDIKYEQAIEIFKNKVKEAKDEQEKQLETRKKELAKLKENNQLTEENIKKLNKDELEVEIKFLENEVDRMHYIYTVGLELVEPIRKVTLDKLIEKI